MNKRLRERWLINLALLIGIGLLLALLLLDDSNEPIIKPTLASYLPDNITRLQIIREGKNTIEFAKEKDTWLMQSPFQKRADKLLLNQLLSLIELEVVSELDATQAKPVDFGLAQPHAIIQLNNQKIRFGDTQPIDKLRYIQIDSKILLVEDRHMTQLNTSSISFINRHLVPSGDKIEQLTIAGKPIELTNSLKTQWQSIKANWLSLSTTDDNNGIPVTIKIAGQDRTLVYLAHKREMDLVLIRDNLEYHLAHSAIITLGLTFGKSAEEQ